MDKIISQGKTTNEAISNGLKELKVSKEMVDIKVLDEDNKKMFYSILAPRVVKVELTIKEAYKQKTKQIKEKKYNKLSNQDFEIVKANLSSFLDDFLLKVNTQATYTIENDENGFVNIELNSDKIGFLIGYRGDTLYSFQDILTQVAIKNLDSHVNISLDICSYKAKRKKTLEHLANSISNKVIRTRKEYKFEPMKAYERKIIHQALQSKKNISTYSIGEEPRRRLVVSYVKK